METCWPSWCAGASFFSDPPELDAASAAVWWDPRACPHVLPLVACRCRAGDVARAFRLSDIPCRTRLLLGSDGQQHLLFRDAERALQLTVSGASLLEPVHLLTEALVGPHVRPARLAALQAFNQVCQHGRIPSSRLPDASHRRRSRLVLQALDGWLAGATQRQIATALFGAARVDADWGDPRGHLRDRVRRAIRRGRALMEGGYRSLLQ
jgi:hypothetical protein